MRGAAALALFYGLAALLLATLMLASAVQGRLITTPAELFDPTAGFLVAGEDLLLQSGGPAVPVTPLLVQAVAVGNIVVFAGAGVLWVLAAVGVWRRGQMARILALILFAGLLLMGVLNLLAVVALLMLAGDLAVAGGAAAVLTTVSGIMVLLVALPLAGFLALVWPGTGAQFTGAPLSRSLLSLALILHFTLVACLLMPAVLAPETLWPAWILLGPWPLTGLAARLVTLLMALAHGVCAWGWWRRRRWTLSVSLGVSGALALAAGLSALAATDRALLIPGMETVPAVVARVAMAVLALLSLSLLPVLLRARGHLEQSAGEVESVSSQS